jgi:hypothetical protein
MPSLPVCRPARQTNRPQTVPTKWTNHINDYATALGLDWSDKAVRTSVRDWGRQNGHTVARVGVIPRPVLDAYAAAQQENTA